MNSINEKKTIKLTIFRFNPTIDKAPRYETYESEWVPSLTAHMALSYINKSHRANIAFRRGCREAGCGACTIMVNGVPSLACRVVMKDGDVLEPLEGYPVIRDLVIDRTQKTIEMFQKIKYGREGKPIGFISAKPETMEISRGLTICIDCHGCNSICPVWREVPEAFVGPFYMVNIIRSMFNPLEDYDRTYQAVESGLFNCTMCRACSVSCPKEIEIGESIIRARERVVKANLIPEEVRRVRQNIMDADYLFGESKCDKVRWASELGISNSGEKLLFSSCEYLATEEGRRVLTLMVELLQKVGIKLSYLYEEEPCCGGPLYFYGFQEEFKEKATKNQKIFRERGIEEIITPSSLCAYTFKELYPKYLGETRIRVRTLLEILLEKIRSGEMSPKKIGKKKVVFHDPPFLSRYLNLVDEPREILKKIPGINLLEPKYYWGMNTMGDGIMGVNDEVNSKIAQARFKQLAVCGADVILTASAFDTWMLKKNAQKFETKDIEILDIIEFVTRTMEV